MRYRDTLSICFLVDAKSIFMGHMGDVMKKSNREAIKLGLGDTTLITVYESWKVANITLN